SFFFQAEDGIRAFHVTGVQTCALPISTARDPQRATELAAIPGVRVEALDITDAAQVDALPARLAGVTLDLLYINAGIAGPQDKEIGRASCRERVEVHVVDGD